MTATKPRIDRIAYIGWRGIEGCEVLDLDSGPLTGLVGPTGAGKSTLTMCLGYALLPDRDALDIRPISEVKDARKVGIDTLAESIDPRYGYGYVVLDITTRAGSRLLAGIYVEAIDGKAKFTRWLIRDPKGLAVSAILAQEDGQDETFPPYLEFKRHCASRGIDVSGRLKVGEYCQALYEAGILPSGMSMGQDRSLYGSLIETTFKGGVSGDVVKRLKDYLLPKDTVVADIVTGLQDCTNEVIMTKNEIASAEKELNLLQSTYGVGKELVLHSLRSMISMTAAIVESLRQDKIEQTNATARRDQLADDVKRIDSEIEQAENTKAVMRKTALDELTEADAKVTSLRNTLPGLTSALVLATGNRNTFNQGQKRWQAIAGKDANQSIEWVRESLEGRRKAAERDAFKVEADMEKLQAESMRLNSGRASSASEELAESTGGQTLEDALGGVSEQEALSIELALCGLTEGAVGVTPDALAGLAASSALPDTFWLGATAPEQRQLRTIGDWYVAPAAGGYVATKKDRAPVFGSEARIARQKALLRDIDRLRRKHTEYSNSAKGFDESRALLDEHKERIEFYISQRDRAFAIDEAVTLAQRALDVRNEEIKRVETIRAELLHKLEDIDGPYEERLKVLRAESADKGQKVRMINDQLKKLVDKIADDEQTLVALKEESANAKAILGADAARLFSAAEDLPEFEAGRLVVEQTKRLTSLGTALQDEVPGRLAILQNTDPANHLATLRLWPVLMEIVRERVSIDRAEIDGEDLILAMKEHRATLGSKLVTHENEVRISARNLHATISSKAMTEKRKIDKLSKLGENITFGNVVGIRIVLTPRDNMLSVLEGFAGQLFSEQKPVDVALKELFDAASGQQDGTPLTGDQLLDYRNYVDLSIEACRKGSGWAAAASLSGGESIGCGLALALMLTRSIAARGEIKVDQICPLFAVDEAHRLDGPGHAVVVDFAKKENFQVIVAAPELTPSYCCILYALNRVFPPHAPHERLIVRGIKVAA
jgi:chromosome condensin MukBEF ATPase and DNA-binding subunit MukB